MSEARGCVAYLLQESRGAPIQLAVADVEKGQFHAFPISIEAISRLAAECSEAVNAHLGGMSPKHNTREIVEVLSAKWQSER